MLERLSRSELAHMMRLATRCLATTSDSHLEDVVTELGEVIPFRKAALCAVRSEDGGASLEHFVNHSYGPRWADLYTRHGFNRVDPVLNYSPGAPAAFSWREAFSKSEAPRSMSFVEAARDFGFVDGISYTCTATGSRPFRTVLSLADVGGADDRTVRILVGVGPHIHEAYRRRLQDGHERDAVPLLSPREKEVLEWAQEGKTYWEIGRILGISERTVKYHFARIKAKLDVMSPCHAVARAMRMGLIA